MTDVFEIIKTIIEEKEVKRIHPSHALRSEIFGLYTGNNLGSELRTLVRKGLIAWGNTINDVYFKINDYEKI